MNTIKIDASQLYKTAKAPIFDYCRKLIKEGVNPNTRLEVYRGHSDPDVSVPNIGEGSKLTIRENDFEGPRVVKFEELDTSKVR